MKSDEGGFASAINAAMQAPADTGAGANMDLPQLFQFPIPTNEDIIDNEPMPDARRVQGVPTYTLRAHFRRFVMGPIGGGGYGANETVAVEHDDSAAYEDVQNMVLAGRAILCWEKINFQKEGAVIIAVKWMTKEDKKKDPAAA